MNFINGVNRVGSFYHKGVGMGLSHLHPRLNSSLHSATGKVFGQTGHIGRFVQSRAGTAMLPRSTSGVSGTSGVRLVRNMGAGFAVGAGVAAYNSAQRLRYQDYSGAALNAGMVGAMGMAAVGLHFHRGAMSNHLSLMRTMRMGIR
jgi:hypothetical protein